MEFLIILFILFVLSFFFFAISIYYTVNKILIYVLNIFIYSFPTIPNLTLIIEKKYILCSESIRIPFHQLIRKLIPNTK